MSQKNRLWRNRLRLQIINIQHTPSKNDKQVFAELLEVVLVDIALEVIRTKALGYFLLKMTCI